MVDAELALAARLQRLAAHLPVFESQDFSFGEWAPTQTDPDGAIHMPWYRLSAGAEAFLADVGAAGWITPFDWPSWAASPAGRKLLTNPPAVATAGPDDLQRLLTAFVRQDRFSEGTLAAAFESGMLTAIVRRAADLADAGDSLE